jgi:hypothetical protein
MDYPLPVSGFFFIRARHVAIARPVAENFFQLPGKNAFKEGFMAEEVKPSRT